MIRTLQTKVMIGMAMFLFIAGKAHSQISILTKPVSGGVEMSEVSEWGGFVQNFFRATGVSPDFSAFRALPGPGSTGVYSGSALASKGLVRGSIGMNPSYGLNLRGGSNAASTMEIFADVVPGSKVRVEINAGMSLNWIGSGMDNRVSFTFDALVGEDKSDGLDRNSAPLIINGGISRSTLCVSVVSPPASPTQEEGGKTYYKIGTISLNGTGGIDSPDNVELSAGYNAEVTAINAHYVGPALSIADPNTNNQVGHIQETLPQALKIVVTNTATGEPLSDIPITFTLADPAKGGRFSGGGSSLQVTTQKTDGTASTAFTLGASTGVYKIIATCPANVCIPDANKVEFTATARDKALTCGGGICSLHGHVSEAFSNPFILKVIDNVTGQPVSGAQISYEVIRFVDTKLVTHQWQIPGSMIPNPAITEAGGAYSYFTPGTAEGTYVIRARCESCLEVPEQILYAGAGVSVRKEMEEAIAADPSANEANCPSGCCPVTPLVRMGMVRSPNDGVSFTSVVNENKIGLDAHVLPACLNADSNVTWEVADAPGDFMDSGTPAQPAAGPISYFTVGSGDFPQPSDIEGHSLGRPLPLSYKVTASMGYKGVSQKAVAIVRQDEIDKCRQEYIDFGIGLVGVQRSKFTLGIGGGFVDLKDVLDCFAHIYPQKEADKVKTLRAAGHGVTVTSGYRSPRGNWYIGSNLLTNSAHLFGLAVDIAPDPLADSNWKTIWNASGCAKILERPNRPRKMLQCGEGEVPYGVHEYAVDTYRDTDKDGIANVFEEANCLHLGPEFYP